ncbi:MAG TPA: penicillin acylase family protein [Bacteroidales bacterium]|nr:penicillin acylase family protein [Bacteroidales bacterium]HPJ58708.1 penicillin acylase family protein [Bacteroidales bacterium]HPR12395.1 penicillin acylase family protein [Bacteroidales bacterium]HRW84615.1 penicillin acylase family protein [Bacteroidales bacterium]
MRLFRIILFSLLTVIVAGMGAALILVSSIKKGALPVYEGELEISGLGGKVTVYRDERGMPHIYASDEEDLYRAVGFVMAQERLWQMDLIRRVTTGRLSEIFGKDYVQTDLFLRSLEMTAKSKMVLSGESHEIMTAIQAYCDGVNAYIDVSGRKLPPEFRILSYRPDPWKPEDVANIIGYMGWDLASANLSSDISYHRLMKRFGPEKAVELIPDWKTVDSYVFPDFSLAEEDLREAEEFISQLDKIDALGIGSFSGSNNWAVAGKRTATGKPVLCNDMHLGLGSPGIWIQMHQVVKGKLNVTGVVVPGQPFVVGGHNERIAWGLTNLMVDDIDLFSEKINPGNENQYYFNGEWRDLQIRKEVVKIKGEKAQTHELKFTHRGPIVSGFREVNDAVLSMRWSGYDHSDELRSVYLLNRARNIEDFRSAIATFRSISQNFVYADVEGNIGLNTGGGIPVRKGTGTMIRPGETDEFDWKDYVPFGQLPYEYNPERGYVASANNKTVSDDYPWYISSGFALPYRIDRIRQMLDEKEVFDIDDFKKMITDQHSSYASLLTPFILKLTDRKGDFNETENEALAALRDWDYNMAAGLVAPTVFEYFRMSFIRLLLGDELGDLAEGFYGVSSDYYIYRILNAGPDEWVDNIETPEKETLDDIILAGFRDCVARLTSDRGNDKSEWEWGRIHRLVLSHPLGSVKLIDLLFGFNSVSYQVGGSSHTVCPYAYSPGFIVDHGASERHIFNTADWDESFTVIPTGASGVPSAEFYLSQTEKYVNMEFYRDPFSDEAVREASRYTLLLIPAK